MFTDKISSLREETDIIILPEMFTTGFTMKAASLAEEMDGQTMQWMRRVARQKNCIVTGSLIIEEDQKYYNRLLWMQPDGSFHHYDKRHLFRLGEEEKTYTAGDNQWIMHWKGWKIFPLICYDLRFPVWSRRTTSLDYDLLIYVANWPERRIQAWKTLLPARAVENQCFVAGLNRTGTDGNGMIHTGDSAVYDFKGSIISTTKPNEENTETVSLDLEALQEFRKQFPFSEDADSFELQ